MAKKYNTTKGIRIEAENRNGEGWEWEVENIYLGRVYGDGSFGECIRLYIDSTNTFQMEFLKGSNLAYTFLPECTELLEILKDGITGVSLGMIAEELLDAGYEEKDGEE